MSEKKEEKKRQPAHVTALQRAEVRALGKLHEALELWTPLARALDAIAPDTVPGIEEAEALRVALAPVDRDLGDAEGGAQ